MIGHAVPVFQGYASQYGHGLGNVLGGLVRAALPIAGKIAKTAGAKLVDTGLDFLTEKLNKRKPFQHSRKRKPSPNFTPKAKRRPTRSTLQSNKPYKRQLPPGKVQRRHKTDIFA